MDNHWIQLKAIDRSNSITVLRNESLYLYIAFNIIGYKPTGKLRRRTHDDHSELFMLEILVRVWV